MRSVGAANHWVAIIGGATAGAEVAAHLADHGVNVVVFEQNARPYGKIEDGLPRWHEALRRKEWHHIDERLSRPQVHFVPLTRIGKDLAFADVANTFGFSAVVLALGAWRDRPLPVPDVEAFVGRGFSYQNPFVIAFNHEGEEGHMPPPIVDGALVIGGGLAALDVAKILMLQTTRRALAERGVAAPLVELEHKGIPAFLEEHGLTWKELNLRGCTVAYRKRAEDMPLVDAHNDSDLEWDKVHRVRLRLLHHAQEKFLFNVQTLAAPHELLHANGHVTGMRFVRMKEAGDKIISGNETFDWPASLVVSSIGSIPEPMPGIPMNGELYAFTEPHTGRLHDYPNVFAAGNVVTGRGNIAASRKHAKEIAETAVAAFLGLLPQREAEAHLGDQLAEAARAQAVRVANAVTKHLANVPPAASDLPARVRTLQARVGYDGDYAAWIAAHSPPLAA